MKNFFLLTILSLILLSCVKNNPDPAWLEVNEWTLVDNYDPLADPGELTHNITDAWVMIGGEVIGIFEVPFKIPILTTGEKEIRIEPVILNNGISATKKRYPHMEPYIVSANFTSNETVTINPETKYFNSTNFWIEDFEGGDKFTTDAGQSTASLIKDNDPQYSNWGYYGEINLSDGADLWIGDSESMDLPQSNASVYLEIDYYNTNSLETRVLAYYGASYQENLNIRINAQDDPPKWKKIYIELREVVSGSLNATDFKQRLIARLDTAGTNTKVLIDNVKVVY